MDNGSVQSIDDVNARSLRGIAEAGKRVVVGGKCHPSAEVHVGNWSGVKQEIRGALKM